MTITETPAMQFDRFEAALNKFAACIRSLPDSLFLAKIHDWSPRDIVAHLIGWNRTTISGCEQLKKGELPNYYSEAAEDFSTINATFVRQYAAVDKDQLLAELEGSFQALRRYVLALDAADWQADTGVRFQDSPVTIQNSVEALLGDYPNHQQEIEAWRTGLPKDEAFA